MDVLFELVSCSFASFVLLCCVQSLPIHGLTPSHEAVETVLQAFSFASGHFQKDDLIVIASRDFDAGPNSLKILTTGMALPMLYGHCSPTEGSSKKRYSSCATRSGLPLFSAAK